MLEYQLRKQKKESAFKDEMVGHLHYVHVKEVDPFTER